MELKRIEDKNFDAMWKLMQTSFPPFELRTRQSQEAICGRDDFHPDIIVHNGAFAGILFHWIFDNICYIEHFATLPSLRGQGVGAQAMAMLIAEHPLTVLEIDPPINEIAIRRKGFYERVGLIANAHPYRHIGFKPQFTSHELVLMSAPRTITLSELATFDAYLQNTICQL